MTARRPDTSVLLVDIGNTRIKWAIWRAGRLGRMRAEAYAGWSSGDFERRLFRARSHRLTRVIVASVAGEAIARRLAAAAARAGRASASRGSGLGAPPPPIPELITTSRRAAGVVTRYTETWRLGVDRFLGAIAAHHLAGSRGACVINAGTAVTIDVVDGQGIHHGGAILPGPQLMIDSLLSRTAGIARRARGASGRPSSHRRRPVRLFARSTAAAIEEGAVHAIAGAAERAIVASRRLLGVAPLVILTGGGAAELRGLLAVRCVEVPDLVLRGIALRAGLALR